MNEDTWLIGWLFTVGLTLHDEGVWALVWAILYFFTWPINLGVFLAELV